VSKPLNSWRWARLARYFAYCTAGIIVVIIAAALVLPEFLDSPAVRTAIQRKLSEAVDGEIAWDALEIRILPSPHGALRNARVEIPGIASASAEQIDAYLRFWPLLRGHAEITSVSVVRPVIRIDIAPAPAAEGKAKKEPSKGPVEIYRSVASPIVDAVRRFAPDMVLRIDDAGMEVSAPGMPPIQLTKLSLRAQTGSKGMQLELATAANYWSRLKLSARVEFSDLSGKASLDATDIKPQTWLDRYLGKSPVGVVVPVANLSVQARTDGKTSLEADFEAQAGSVEILSARERVQVPGVAVKAKAAASVQETVIHLSDARVGASKLAGGTMRYSAENNAIAGHVGFDLDLAQGMHYTRRLVPEVASAVLAWFEPVSGRAHGDVKLAAGHSGWSVGVDVLKSDASLQIRDLPGPVRLTRGSVEIDRHVVKVDRVALSMPAGHALLSTLRYSMKDGTTKGSAEFDLDLTRAVELARRLLPEKNRDALAVVQSTAGRAQGNARFAFGRGDWTASVDVLKSDSAVGLRILPGPVRLATGSVEINPRSVKIDRAALSMLDATATASATISDFPTQLRVKGAISEGTAGDRFLGWVQQIARVPPHLALKAPIQVEAQQYSWGPNQALGLQATARFDAGPGITVDLGWKPKSLNIRRVAIKDKRSDAALSLRAEGRLLEGRFAGSLHSTSIAAMLKNAQVPSGTAAGDLRFIFDRDNPRRTTAEGNLKGDALDLAWLLRRPVRIERIDVAADGTSLRIREATVNWAGQLATIRGEVKHSESGPIIDAQLDSPGLVVDALLPPGEVASGGKSVAADERLKQPPGDKDELSWLWPVPVTGRVAVNSKFVQAGRHRVAPVVAVVVLEEQRAHVDLKQAQLCGISLPLAIEATPKGFLASARITAHKQQLEQTAHCLTNEGLRISGDFDVKADINTHGKPQELVQNLKGTISTEVRDGRVMKFALLGNILSMQNISALLREGGPKLDEAGFPYRRIVVAGRFEAGRFIVDESAFHSDAVGLAATGWISLLDHGSRLTVLVAPFSRVDDLARKVPILGYILGGVFTSLPVGVSGDIRDPRVVPLGPGAVTSELTGIFERTLKLPVKLMTLPDGGRKAAQ